ncbi:MAG TPA: TonB-dependent siderophore receptor [Croceibacterium sp.]|nr:TonB-dependent siderophore receptor [Croceibacterium sp.]
MIGGVLVSISLPSYAQSAQSSPSDNAAVQDVIVVISKGEKDPDKGYVGYKEANVTRNGQTVKDTPQTIDTIDVSKYKLYGANDLSVMLAGTPGVTTQYDMRGDGIMIRGFSADSGDIYRDGIRESGQVRRSTANIERIEILKGPASLLYGRSSGGGIVNMVSKSANFVSPSSVGVYAGSFSNLGATIDVNEAVTPNLAMRLTGEWSDSDSFRANVGSRITMMSPSVTFSNHSDFTWTAQYTYDKLERSPDRGPSYENLPEGTSIRASFVQDDDYVDDVLSVARSEMSWTFAPQWTARWAISHRSAEQNLDHFYGGTWCSEEGLTLANASCSWNGYVRQTAYAWQETSNKTVSNALEVKGEFNTGSVQHNVLVAVDSAWEDRQPRLFSNGNSNCSGTSLCGYVNPFDYSDRYNDRATKPRPSASQHNHHQAQSQSAFVQDVITLVPQVKLVLGLRYDWYRFRSTNLLLEEGAANRTRQYSDSTISPSAGIVWKPSEAHSIYASYNKSFAPYGGRGLLSVAVASSAVYDDEPQFQQQYEAGIKSDWFGGRLNTQLSVFNLERSNIRYRPDPENDPYTWAVQGKQRSIGVEFSAIGRIIDTLFVRGGGSYIESTVREDVATPANVGKSLANTARETGNLFLRYVPVEWLYIEGGVTYVGDQWTNLANTTRLPGYERFDAAVGYSVGNINMTLAVSNITDKVYWRSAAMPGAPRSALFRLNYQF